MSNCCYFTIDIKGANRESAIEFAKAVKDGKLGRVYNDVSVADDVNGTVNVGGDCAGSMASAFHLERPNSPFRVKAKRLGISLEAYSEESGCGFQEHIVMKDGEFAVSESTDWQSVYIAEADDAEWAEILADHGFSSREEAMECCLDDESLSIGGFDWVYPGCEQEARNGGEVHRDEIVPTVIEEINPDLLYKRPNPVWLPDYIDGAHYGVRLTDEDVEEVWGWFSKRELANELSYQLGPDGRGDDRAVSACTGDDAAERCKALFEHVWPFYWDQGKARSITDVALEGIASWVKEGGAR